MELLRKRWGDAVRELIAAHPMLATALEPILAARDQLTEKLTPTGGNPALHVVRRYRLPGTVGMTSVLPATASR